MTAPHQPLTGLVLSGGGARAAYQVGVLEAIADLRISCGLPRQNSPFQILCGTSAGAINASALACGADHFDDTVRHVASVWRHFEAEQVYRADSISVLRSGAHWLTLLSLGWTVARWRKARPHALLNNQPLAELLTQLVRLERLPGLIQDGHLDALAVTASSYTTGEHVTFYQSREARPPWIRSQRKAVRAEITHAHLLASSAIPFIFPARSVTFNQQTHYLGDGSMRQTAPIAPAIHLGADRILVVGAGRMNEPELVVPRGVVPAYPSLAQIGGHALSSIFLDALSVDVERAERINQTLSLIPPDARARSPLRPLNLLVLSPSERIDEIASRHIGELPATIRALLGAVGVKVPAPGQSPTGMVGGAALASYLLFEAGFTGELMELGRRDAMARTDEICAFFGWTLPGKDRMHGETAPPTTM
ncbi:patatin-like phospholipase family protein [Diaphorobacter ruginosibacter]|uniref:Patatin-like phospholipase family protein n=1 Tax=Diaphorobacter ruginosibacter TaxID=1715720 RepID=A0A7G9RLP7_9BURK|nr:patatin-like phospholipase family protein [Diaphorobacter ruginosibacter]QNN56522.1 patatin-like phospholipase family protein [Diaphorobacter ruginosibacter]